MKARIITSLMALAALLAASCAKESGQKETAPLPQVPISVEASVSGLTKAVTNGLQTSFEDGDQLTLYAWTGSNAAVPEKKVVSGVVNTFDGTKWTPASTMLWKNVSDAHYFLGISPARTVNNFTADAVSSSEDLLVATVLGDGIVAPQTVTAPPVALEFSHVMAWLKVNVKYRNQWGGVPTDLSVTAKAATAGTINYLTKTITPGEVTAQVLVAAETAAEGYAATYSSLCLPQEGVRTIEFVIDGQKLVYTHAEDIPLAAGTVTTLSLLVGKDKIALENNTVSDWEEGVIENPSDPVSAQLGDVTRPLTLKAVENGTTVTFTDRSSGKVTWITSDGRSGTISLINNTVSLAAGQRVWFIGDGTNNAFGTGVESTSSSIALNKDAEVYGNIMSLLGPDFATATTLPGNNTFAYLFSGQTHLKNSTEEGLYLPATTLTAGCYRGLFKGCTGLSQVVVNATDISASNGLTDWVNGIAGAGFGLVTPDPKLWTMGGNLPWGATVYTQGESGPEAVFTTPTALATNLTYNGSAQTLINAGTAHKEGVVLEYSTNNGTSWSTSVPTGTNAGNYNVYCRVQGGGVKSAALAKSIAKAAPTYTAPTKKSNLTYNGGSQALVNAGSATGGTMQYKLGSSGSWSATVPSQTNAGSYTVSWKVVGDANHTDVNETSLGNISIAKKAPTFNLSTTSVSFANTENVNSTKTVTITYDGDGTLSQSSNNTAKVTVSRSDKTLTLTRKDGGAGSVTITVSASAGTNYSAPANKTITVSLAATDGHLLKDAAVGYAVADNGLAYADKNNIPDGAKIIGMVAYKNGNNGLIMEKAWSGSKAYSDGQKNQPAADNANHAFGSAQLCTTSKTKTTLYWFVGTKANYESCGLTSQAGFNSVNTKRLNAGCEDLNNQRTYGTSDGWEFYGGSSTFWYNYWSGGSHIINLLISF